MRNARVFISCGQGAEREREIGKFVEDFFKGRGFETYFAERVHSPDALTENIFKFLRNSEYFIFIDFKRDSISATEYRGSLFVNQEIAIATFLGLPGFGFAEKGVKREGIAGYQIYNPIPFEDGTTIIKNLENLTRNWDKNFANELKITFDPSTVSRNMILQNHPNNPRSDWFHLNVHNRHHDKHALSCLAYISKIKDILHDREVAVPVTVELIWSAIGDISANILARSIRQVDAFFWIHGEDQIHFHSRPLGTTNQRYQLPSLAKGRYLIEYTVVASSFETVHQTFLLQFEKSGEEITFREAEDIK
jgi:hypothetical protein